jgi:hypothetical protein
MAFPTKSGKSFGSAYVAKRHDDEYDKKAQGVMGAAKTEPKGMTPTPEHEAAEKPQFEAGEKEGQAEGVVAEHGPATNVTVHHDHKNNRHHVVSRHADGHMNTSDHASAQEAHDTASTLGGAEPSGQAQGQPQAEEAPAADGFAMPKLA